MGNRNIRQDSSILPLSILDVINNRAKFVSEISPLPVSALLGGISIGDSANLDSFARLRVSNPQTLFDSKNIFNDPDLADSVESQPLFYDNQEVSGSGTGTLHIPNRSSQSLSVSANTAGRRVRQTKMRFNYQPGKSQLVLMTFNLNGASSGIVKREGIFDENNGLFIELTIDGIFIVRRSNTSGSPVDIRIAQTNWNVDKMDGSGASGYNLDFTKTQILIIDYEWLGVGRVRFGFVVEGIPIYCHYILNANVLDLVYMRTPNLPLRSEISNDGTGGNSTIEQICSTVISEGGSQDLGALRHASTNGTHVDCNVENTIYGIIGIRLRDAYIGASIKIINASLQIQTGSEKIEWILIFNPTVAGSPSYVAEPQSAIEVARGVAANTITDGYEITGGFIESGGVQNGNSGGGERGIENAILLGSNIAGTVKDTIWLCVRPIAGSVDVDIEGALSWRELL